MPTNKREYILYNCFMVFYMVFFMSFYNITFALGFSWDALKQTWLGMPLSFVIAFTCESLIAGRLSMKLTGKVLRYEVSFLKKRAVMSFFIVICMASLMSVYGAVMSVGFAGVSFHLWLRMVVMNFIVAYPLAFFGGPIVLFVFRKVFPHGTIVVPVKEKI